MKSSLKPMFLMNWEKLFILLIIESKFYKSYCKYDLNIFMHFGWNSKIIILLLGKYSNKIFVHILILENWVIEIWYHKE